MSNSGPNGTYKTGSWDGLQLPVTYWRAWTTSGDSYHSDTTAWDDLPDTLATVYVYHEGRGRTRMRSVDGYPPPPGWTGETKQGAQLGEVDCSEWLALKAQIDAEA